MPDYDATLQTPFVQLGIVLRDGVLCGIDFLHDHPRIEPSSRAAAGICTHIRRYFDADAVYEFDLPCRLEGTAFQRRVWYALRRIPFGEVRTYGEIAAQLHTSARAVGNACRRNPVPLVVPCHRVVAARGIGGYAGAVDGRVHAIKRNLLQHEAARAAG